MLAGLRHKKLLRRNWHQPLNHLVKVGQPQAFASLLEGRELVFSGDP